MSRGMSPQTETAAWPSSPAKRSSSFIMTSSMAASGVLFHEQRPRAAVPSPGGAGPHQAGNNRGRSGSMREEQEQQDAGNERAPSQRHAKQQGIARHGGEA